MFSSVKDAVYHFCTATATKQNCKNNLILWSCVAFLGCSRWTARWLLIKSNKEKKRNSHITIQGFVHLAISPLSQAKSSISPRFFSSLPFYNVWWFYRPVLHALSVSLYPGALGLKKFGGYMWECERKSATDISKACVSEKNKKHWLGISAKSCCVGEKLRGSVCKMCKITETKSQSNRKKEPERWKCDWWSSNTDAALTACICVS